MARHLLESHDLIGRQVERFAQQTKRVAMRIAANPALDVTERTDADTGALSQLFLGQATGGPSLLERERQGWWLRL
jgi:hypothetical protein